jgi:transcriptional regulator with XRE-family HTH domain
MNFPERLKSLRKTKNITQDDLAKILNYGRTAIAGYEGGRNEPAYEVLEKLSKYFDVSIDYLLGKTDNPNTYVVTDIPIELRELGVEYYTVNKEAKDKGITPEDLKRMIKAIEALKGT